MTNIVRVKQITAKEARNRFGQLLDTVQRTPVRVTKNGRPVSVMMSMQHYQHYERLRAEAWERLISTMDAMGKEASENGLTEAKLEALLADES